MIRYHECTQGGSQGGYFSAIFRLVCGYIVDVLKSFHSLLKGILSFTDDWNKSPWTTEGETFLVSIDGRKGVSR